jgi:hypothetical protein
MDKAKQFIIWLDGFLDGHETLDEAKTTKLKDTLDGLFDHNTMDAITADKPTLTLGELDHPEFPLFLDGADGKKMRC